MDSFWYHQRRVTNLDENLFIRIGVVCPCPARVAAVAPKRIPGHALRLCTDVTRGAEVLSSVGVAPVQRSIGRHDHQVQVVHQQTARRPERSRRVVPAYRDLHWTEWWGRSRRIHPQRRVVLLHIIGSFQVMTPSPTVTAASFATVIAVRVIPCVRNANLESDRLSLADALLVEHEQVQSRIQAQTIPKWQYVTQPYFSVTCAK